MNMSTKQPSPFVKFRRTIKRLPTMENVTQDILSETMKKEFVELLQTIPFISNVKVYDETGIDHSGYPYTDVRVEFDVPQEYGYFSRSDWKSGLDYLTEAIEDYEEKRFGMKSEFDPVVYGAFDISNSPNSESRHLKMHSKVGQYGRASCQSL